LEEKAKKLREIVFPAIEKRLRGRNNTKKKRKG
jgi:hypothetical protein